MTNDKLQRTDSLVVTAGGHFRSMFECVEFTAERFEKPRVSEANPGKPIKNGFALKARQKAVANSRSDAPSVRDACGKGLPGFRYAPPWAILCRAFRAYFRIPRSSNRFAVNQARTNTGTEMEAEKSPDFAMCPLSWKLFNAIQYLPL
jgi:hypothetical protein